MKSFVAVSSVVVLIAAQFICETQGLPMRPVTLKETGGMKFKDAKTKGSAHWESLLAKMKNGASNGAVGSELQDMITINVCAQAGHECDGRCCDDKFVCRIPGSGKGKGNQNQMRCLPEHVGETLGKKAAKLSGAKMAKKD
eukprot:385447_1